ncbi:MAG: right-handed parallel beta-helix repeat-containing protein [Candidatus Krumholzibacteriia bacterium]
MRHLALIPVLLIGSMASAATWHVAQDGSGDFTIIQDAVDAASAGDVIRIHAGRYLHITEHWDVYGNGTSFADNHVVITKDNLTLQGDGPDVTIIGPASYPSDPGPNYTGISVTYNEANTLTIRDLAVENVRYGVFGACPYLNVTNCRFFDTLNEAIYLRLADGLTEITDCFFDDCGGGLFGHPESDNIEVRNCVFEASTQPMVFIGNTGVVIDGCEITGALGAINLQQGSIGSISNCSIYDSVVNSIATSLDGYVDVSRCIIEGGQSGLFLQGGGGCHVEECTFRGQTYAAAYISSHGPNVITDCNILNGGLWSVYCLGSADCYLDMRGNYWGTDSEAQIQAWIYDANDNPAHNCTVDYIPFSNVVSIEEKSWSAVKGLFVAPERGE